MLEQEAKEAVLRLEQSNRELKAKFNELFEAIQQVKTEVERRMLVEQWENYVQNSYRFVSTDDLEWYEHEEEPKGSLGK